MGLKSSVIFHDIGHDKFDQNRILMNLVLLNKPITGGPILTGFETRKWRLFYAFNHHNHPEFG